MQVVILDELSINYDEVWKMKSGETSELEEILTWLRQNTAMTLAALSSTFLLDRVTSGATAALFQSELDEMITRTGFEAVCLKQVMRSSQNIAAATSPASVSKARKLQEIQETISPGVSSTVPGTRPRAMVYKYTPGVDYKKLAGFVTQHLRTIDTEFLKCIVLTDSELDTRNLTHQLRRGNTPVSCYDPRGSHRENEGGEAELIAWLRAECGILVTSEVHSRGAEADYIIYVTTVWGNSSNNRIRSPSSNNRIRSPVTRAVAGLLMITSDYDLNVKEMREHWEVNIMEDGVNE